MTLRERFHQIIEPTTRLVEVRPEWRDEFVAEAVQLCLEAVCAEEGHAWPMETKWVHDTEILDGMEAPIAHPYSVITGPCRRCGKEMP